MSTIHVDTITLAEIRRQTIALMNEHDLLTLGWTFKWDNARKRAGQCRYRSKEIGLSKPVFAVEANRHAWRETALHEIAHAVVGAGAGHGYAWQAKMREFGLDPRRLLQGVQLPRDNAYLGTCDCGVDKHVKYRMTRGMTYTCNRCRTVVTWRKS